MITLSVFDTLNYIKNIIDTDNNLRNIIVSGEISNFHKHTSGHLYFSLKDDKARINCVMFKSYTTTLRFLPKDGDKVLIKATASVFVSSGQLQLYVSEIKKDGIGDLYIEFEKLKNKSFSTGYKYFTLSTSQYDEMFLLYGYKTKKEMLKSFNYRKNRTIFIFQ